MLLAVLKKYWKVLGKLVLILVEKNLLLRDFTVLLVVQPGLFFTIPTFRTLPLKPNHSLWNCLSPRCDVLSWSHCCCCCRCVVLTNCINAAEETKRTRKEGRIDYSMVVRRRKKEWKKKSLATLQHNAVLITGLPKKVCILAVAYLIFPYKVQMSHWKTWSVNFSGHPVGFPTCLMTS